MKLRTLGQMLLLHPLCRHKKDPFREQYLQLCLSTFEEAGSGKKHA